MSADGKKITLKDIYNDLVDNDKKVLKACFNADKELAEEVQEAMTKEISAIWYALLTKNIVTDEEMIECKAEIDKASEEVKKEKGEIKSEC